MGEIIHARFQPISSSPSSFDLDLYLEYKCPSGVNWLTAQSSTSWSNSESVNHLISSPQDCVYRFRIFRFHAGADNQTNLIFVSNIYNHSFFAAPNPPSTTNSSTFAPSAPTTNFPNSTSALFNETVIVSSNGINYIGNVFNAPFGRNIYGRFHPISSSPSSFDLDLYLEYKCASGVNWFTAQSSTSLSNTEIVSYTNSNSNDCVYRFKIYRYRGDAGNPIALIFESSIANSMRFYVTS